MQGSTYLVKHLMQAGMQGNENEGIEVTENESVDRLKLLRTSGILWNHSPR